MKLQLARKPTANEDHEESLTIMEWAGFDLTYMFQYSERPGTKAARKFKDDVSESIKSEGLYEMIKIIYLRLLIVTCVKLNDRI